MQGDIESNSFSNQDQPSSILQLPKLSFISAPTSQLNEISLLERENPDEVPDLQEQQQGGEQEHHINPGKIFPSKSMNKKKTIRNT